MDQLLDFKTSSFHRRNKPIIVVGETNNNEESSGILT